MAILAGIGNFLKNITAEKNGVGFGDRLSLFGARLQDIDDGGDRAIGVQRNILAQSKMNAEQAQRKELMDIANTLNLSPREKLTFLANPEKWAESNASRYGARNVNGGDSIVYGEMGDGGTVYTAPKLGMDGGYAYTQTPDGLNITGQRGKSYVEINAEEQLAERMRAALEDEKIKRGQLGVAQGNLAVNRGQLGLSGARLSLDRQKFDWDKSKEPGGSPAGAPWKRKW